MSLPPPPEDSPETEHTSLLHDARAEITPMIMGIFDVLHETGAVTSNEQWTIPINASCGFSGEIVLRVEKQGTCKWGTDPFGEEMTKDRVLRFLDFVMQHFGILPEEEN
jgi:hypothetical protein